MRRVAMAAMAALGLWAGQAEGLPIHVYGTGVLTDYHVSIYTDPPTDTPVNATIEFSVYYDTTGTVPNGYPYYGSGDISYSTPVFPTIHEIGAGPSVFSGATTYDLSYYGGAIFDLRLAVAAPVVPTQGAIAFLPGSTISVGSGSAASSFLYTGYLTSVTTISAVPEAATWAMMTIGLGMIGGSRRRRRAGAAPRTALA